MREAGWAMQALTAAEFSLRGDFCIRRLAMSLRRVQTILASSCSSSSQHYSPFPPPCEDALFHQGTAAVGPTAARRRIPVGRERAPAPMTASARATWSAAQTTAAGAPSSPRTTAANLVSGAKYVTISLKRSCDSIKFFPICMAWRLIFCGP